jgi:hypothetical protein
LDWSGDFDVATMIVIARIHLAVIFERDDCGFLRRIFRNASL